MDTYSVYSGVDWSFEDKVKAECVVVVSPDLSETKAYFYRSYEFSENYDENGYYSFKQSKKYILKARFFPFIKGKHVWRVICDGKEVFTGEFIAVEPKKQDGYIRVSDDKRYFCYDNKDSFVPIGVNLESDIPSGCQVDGGGCSRGLKYFLNQIEKFCNNGVNLIRISTCDPLFNVRTDSFNNYIEAGFYHLERVVEFCRKRSIKIILTLDSFKTFKENSGFAPEEVRRVRDPISGIYLNDAQEFLSDQVKISMWLQQIGRYLIRFSNDPVIMAYELWDEIDRIDAAEPIIERFAQSAISYIRQKSPKNMVVESFSPIYNDETECIYKKAAENSNIDFLPVHAFLNIGVPNKEYNDSIQRSIETAAEKTATRKKPILFTETGALDNMKGKPFSYYSDDYDGVLFDESVFIPFFKGAAGTGILKHTAQYLQVHNLFSDFVPFVSMLGSVKIHTQRFKAHTVTRKKTDVYVLKGRSVVFMYLRNKECDWKNTLRDFKDISEIKGLSLPSYSGKNARVYNFRYHQSQTQKIDLKGKDSFIVGPFKRGCFIRITL